MPFITKKKTTHRKKRKETVGVLRDCVIHTLPRWPQYSLHVDWLALYAFIYLELLISALRSCPLTGNARRRGSTLVDAPVSELINTGLPTKDLISIQGSGREICLHKNKDFRNRCLMAYPQYK